MTLRLYHDSAALTFDATVVGHDGDPTRVLLDRTAFYPTSGGQPHDTGVLGGVRVVDVIDADVGIVHLVDRAIPLGPVDGAVDAVRRLDHTVQHTAQHLLSAIAADRFGWDTASVHFGADHSTIELATGSASEAELHQLETWANEEIAADRAVTCQIEPEGAVGLRKPSERDGPLRIVTIEGIDRSACGGTHVTSTARLGSIWIRGSERMRGHVRITFLAGLRILAVAERQAALLDEVSAAAGAGVDEVAELVTQRFALLRAAERRIGALETEVAELEADHLVAAATSVADGPRTVTDLGSSRTADALRALARAVASRVGVRFVGTITSPPLIVVAAHPESGWHAGNVLRSTLGTVGGSGGGTPLFAQGTAPSPEAIDQVVGQLLA